MTTSKTVKLVKTQATQAYSLYPPIIPGLQMDMRPELQVRPYNETIRLSRFFYQNEPIAATVISRIAEITVTKLRNNRQSITNNGVLSDEEYNLFNGIASIIQPYLQAIILSYLIDGMAIPQYEITKVMGNRLNPNLGRTRYFVPQKIWIRDPSYVRLYRTLNGYGRRAMIQIPSDDINFITSNGRRSDGTYDTEAYIELTDRLPDYVAAIKSGKTTFPIDDYIIFRKLMPYNDYPIPYLAPALMALDHKRYLKMLDRATASRAIEAIRHIKVGSDEYPADDDDIDAAKSALEQTSSIERVYNLFTNHTLSMEWVVPPMESLLNTEKYDAANADIFFALGFPRILTVGETEKSNSADNKIASLGIMSTLLGIQNDILEWIKHVYADVAERNNVTRIPEPYFTPILLADVTSLIQYAEVMQENGTISKNTIAGLYGSSFETELEQRIYEKDSDIKEDPATIPPVDTTDIPKDTVKGDKSKKSNTKPENSKG